jgi:hypothetical protein
MWMGGTVPLGYEVKDRKLVVNAAEAARVRLIFQRYLALGCVSQLRDDLQQRGVLSKRRILTSGRVLGGCSFGRGALYHLLQNRIYLGEVVHKGVSYPGEQERIIDNELWNAVQATLEANRGVRRRSRIETGALLGGLFFDDRGNLMSPTHSISRGNRFRYYVSRALVRGSKEPIGFHGRIGATDVERLVVETLSRQLSKPELMNDVATGIWSAETRTIVRGAVERVVLGKGKVQIFRRVAAALPSGVEAGEGDTPPVHIVPAPTPQPRARKKIIAPGGGSNSTPRRLSHDLVLAIARAKTWMRDLRSGKYADTEQIASHFKLNDAHVRRLLRFCYLAPDIMEAIVEGRQPRSLTVKRLLKEIPRAWPDQRAAFGFTN